MFWRSCHTVYLFLTLGVFQGLLVIRPVSANVCGALQGSLINVSETLAVAICSESIVRVVKVPSQSQKTASTSLLERSSLMVQDTFAESKVDFRYNSDTKTITTKRLIVSIKEDDSLEFADAATKEILTGETMHAFAPKLDVDGDGVYKTFSTAQAWSL